jgi:Flp pilus assembly protein TadB
MKTLRILSLLFFTFCFFSPLEAALLETQQAELKQEVVSGKKNKSWRSWKKQQKKQLRKQLKELRSEGRSSNALAFLALFFGILTPVLLINALAIQTFFLLVLGVLVGIAADVIAIIALRKIRREPDRYYGRKMALTGLFISLLTGVLPLIGLLIIVFSF